MAIYRPGQRFRYHRLLSRKIGKRELTVILSLTAMVDMFTVLVIFLLQNYNATGDILYIPKEVVLPKASVVSELKPSIVVTVSSKEILIERDSVVTYDEIKTQEEMVNKKLYEKMKETIENARLQYQNQIQSRLKEAVEVTKGGEGSELNPWTKVTLQADKDVDISIIKKVMGSITEAGAGQINFAVSKHVVESGSN